MAKILKFAGINVTESGEVFLKVHKLSMEGDFIGLHHFAFPIGCDVNAQIAIYNEHMATQNFAPISDADVTKLTAICNTTWTAEVIATYQAAQAAAEAARNA